MSEAQVDDAGTANPMSIWAWVGMNYDLSPEAKQQIYLIAANDILGDED